MLKTFRPLYKTQLTMEAKPDKDSSNKANNSCVYVWI